MTRKRNLEVLESLYLSDKHSDMKIVCGTKTFPAHKAIVCPQSDYFDKACSGKFKEASGEFKFPDKDPAVMERVLEFLYKGPYTHPEKAQNLENQTPASSPPAKRAKIVTPTAPVATSNTNTFFRKTIGKGSAIDLNGASLHATILAEADYFMIPQLKKLAKERFHEIFWVENRSHFAVTVKEIYSSRADYAPLRNLLVRKMLADPWSIYQNVDDKLVKSVPDFAVDLFAGIMRRIKAHKLKLQTVQNNTV